MTNGRKRIVTTLSALALGASFGLMNSSPAQAEPDIDDVSKQVDSLYHEAEQASERYHDAKIELDQLTKDLDSLEADEAREGDALDSVRDDVKDSIIRQYQGESLSAVGQVVVSEDPSAFLGQLSTMSAFSAIQDGLFDDYATGLEALDIRRDATSSRLEQVARTEQQLADEKKTIDEKLADAEALLSRLEEEERAALAAADTAESSTGVVPANVPASGRAAAAIDYAMAQVGDSYVYGASGPDSFDCSGLTSMAWAAAGVSIPRSSSAQYAAGAKVSADDLQPGDLVFYYSPISHVAMYIGNGMIVHAANPGSGVTTADLYSMPYVGAVRPG